MAREIDPRPDAEPSTGERLLREWPNVEARESGAGKALKAGPVRVRADMTVAQGFQIIVASCIRHFRLNERILIERRDVEALHQARVALRRLRCAFSLFRPAIADGDAKRLRHELRWAMGELSSARNIDVLFERDLPQAERERLGEERDRARESAIAALESPRFQRLILDLSTWVARGDWRRSDKAAKQLMPFMTRRIDRLWSRVASARKLRAMDERERHRLRIDVKKLRYALEFGKALHVRHRKRRKKFGRAVEDIQESLGRVHDLSIAPAVLSADTKPTIAQEESEERRHLRAAKRALRRLRETRPYWRDQRG